jgi:hypothetical protein
MSDTWPIQFLTAGGHALLRHGITSPVNADFTFMTRRQREDAS